MKQSLTLSALGSLLAALALVAAGCHAEAPQDNVSQRQEGASPAPMPPSTSTEAPAPPADPAIDTVEGDVKDAVGALKQDVARGADALKRDVRQAASEMKSEHLDTTFNQAGYEVPKPVRDAAEEVKQGVDQVDGVVQQKAESIEMGVRHAADQVEQGVKSAPARSPTNSSRPQARSTSKPCAPSSSRRRPASRRSSAATVNPMPPGHDCAPRRGPRPFSPEPGTPSGVGFTPPRSDSRLLDTHLARAIVGSTGMCPWLVPGPVFKTVEGSCERLLVVSIPIHSRQDPCPGSDVARVVPAPQRDWKSAAKALGFRSSPVAWRVRAFQPSVLPGAKTRVLHEVADGPVAHVVRLRRVDAVEHLAGDRVVDLRGEQLAHHVVVIIGRGADDVDLAGVVGRVAALGTAGRLGTSPPGPTRGRSGPDRGPRRAPSRTGTSPGTSARRSGACFAACVAPASSKALGSARRTPIASSQSASLENFSNIMATPSVVRMCDSVRST